MRRVRLARFVAILLVSCSAFGGKLEATDAGPTNDPRMPDGGSVEGGAAFCTTVGRTDLLFCDDFEQGTGFASWKLADNDTAARYTIGEPGFSSKAAARLELVPHPRADADARMERVFAERAYSWFRVEAMLRIVRREASDADLINISFGQSGTLKLRALGNVREIARFSDGGQKAPDSHGTLNAVPLGEWIPVAMEFDFRRDSSKATVVVRGADVVRDVELDRPDGSSPFSLRIGPAETPSPTVGWLLEVDDVVVRGRP